MNTFYRPVAVILVMLLIISALSGGVAAQSGGADKKQSLLRAKWRRSTPMVLEEKQSTNIIMETKISGTPSSVELALTNGSFVQLVDNGTNGDQVAGDKIYTAILTPSQMLHRFTADKVNRNFIGFLRLFRNGVIIKKYNFFIDILTSDIPPIQITTVTSDVQYSENLVNIVDPNFYKSYSIQHVTKKFYSHFSDLYDYINVIYEISHFKNRSHWTIRNDVQGIGARIVNHTDAYGSSGRLLGRTEFPIPTMFDGASRAYQHELGHQWINFLKVPPLNHAIPHWPLSDLASGIMGWGMGPNKQGLNFNFDLVPSGSDYQLVPNHQPKVFSDLSLYLMGFLPADQVQPHFVFSDQTQSPSNGAILSGPAVIVSINDIISHLGPRIPDHTQAQKTFRIATIIVSKDGFLSVNAMRLYDWFSRRATGTQIVRYTDGFVKAKTKPFHLTTRGIGKLDTRIERHQIRNKTMNNKQQIK
ncbi:MAG: hypothetical protein GY751_01960 [Bacteroidetes bacterium]|nr:hypothetical protein [Bacteroidota bacterium]